MGTVKISMEEYKRLLRIETQMEILKRAMDSNTFYKEELFKVITEEVCKEEKTIEVPGFMGAVNIEDLETLLNGNKVDEEGNEE